ncbi:sensor histidine kinase [Oerskovia sp. NPDC057915]|uniref:sensor histidine kinase n=1 Tax=Oerskovia sp. NPDC057915 TaxID=3346280 RepID=UPI0036D7C8A9
MSTAPTTGPTAPVSRASIGEIATIAFAVALGALALGLAVARTPDAPALRWVADGAAGVAAVALLGLRRRRPVLVAVLVVAASTFCSAVLGAVFVAVVSLATTRRWWPVAGVGVLFVASTMVDEVTGDASRQWWAQAVIVVTVYAACVGLGAYQGSRRELVEALNERALAAEREQTARVEQAKVAERTRIAREMHDVLAHRISLVAMNAGVLAFRPDLPPDQVAAAAGVVRDNANLALVELKQVLGVLRSSDLEAGASVPDRPQPTLADVDDLALEAVDAGTPVRVEVDAATREHLPGLPGQLSRDGYRIVQEALTNARKHAAGAQVVVGIEGAPGGLLTVEVRNAPGSASGHHQIEGGRMGLVGIAERARLAGGQLEHGPDGRGGYVLRTVLPWPEGDS